MKMNFSSRLREFCWKGRNIVLVLNTNDQWKKRNETKDFWKILTGSGAIFKFIFNGQIRGCGQKILTFLFEIQFDSS